MHQQALYQHDDACRREIQSGRLGPLINAIVDDPARYSRNHELATAAGIGRARLHTLFLEATGLTPGAYLRRQRLDLAVRLLQETAFSITEVALHCGYSEHSALTRALKRELGRTPMQLKLRPA